MSLLIVGLLLGAPEISIEGKTIVFLPMVLDERATQEFPENLEDSIVDVISGAKPQQVTGPKDIVDMLTFEAQKQLLGCDEFDCMAEIAGALDADHLIGFEASWVDETWLLTAKLLKPKTSEVEHRIAKLVTGTAIDVVRALPSLMGELLGVKLEAQQTLVSLTKAQKSRVNLQIDLGGALSYGPRIAVEAGEKFAGEFRLRFLNAGIASVLGAQNVERGESLEFGLGVGVGGRWYLSQTGNMRGPFVGISAEYWYVRVVDRDFDREAYISHMVVPQAEAGYRFTFERVLLSVGAGIGYALSVASLTQDLSLGVDNHLNPAAGGGNIALHLIADVGFFL